MRRRPSSGKRRRRPGRRKPKPMTKFPMGEAARRRERTSLLFSTRSNCIKPTSDLSRSCRYLWPSISPAWFSQREDILGQVPTAQPCFIRLQKICFLFQNVPQLSLRLLCYDIPFGSASVVLHFTRRCLHDTLLLLNPITLYQEINIRYRLYSYCSSCRRLGSCGVSYPCQNIGVPAVVCE